MKDRSIRLFNIVTGKNVVNILEPLSSIAETQNDQSNVYHMENSEYEKKMNL